MTARGVREAHRVDLPDLPVRAVLDELRAVLDERGSAVLVAPPGTGKTTVVPLDLLRAVPGRIVVAEPRRLAARAAAARMASMLGEQVGDTVGYAVRGDRKVSARSRIEVVTSGLLVRRVQRDPELPGVDLVMLDECHERHLDADLLLALLVDARGGLRPDLRLLATSATVAADRLSGLLGDGDPAPVVTAHARTYPVDIGYAPPMRRETVEHCVARAVRRAITDAHGDVLAFLPGVGEIRRVTGLLHDLSDVDGDVDVLPLHGRLPIQQQDSALRAGLRRRVVLATAVAESSLTVPGVRIVVDSGQSRVARVDHRRGLSGLATVRVSAAVAEQRAGRAGREGPGRVLRCWAEHEHSTLPRYPEPEVRTADLTGLALELACWGTGDGAALTWWDEPPAGALEAGREVLRALGALDADGGLTARGRRLADLGLHPRLARALLDGAAAVGARPAAEVVALLDDDGLAATDDLDAALRSLRHRPPERYRREVTRLARLVDRTADRTTDRTAAGTKSDPGLLAALAYPERLARNRPDSGEYLMAGGTAVELAAGSGLSGSEWLAVAVADRAPGRAHGQVRLAATIDETTALRIGEPLLTSEEIVEWADGDVRAAGIRRLGAIVLRETAITDPDRSAIRAALLTGLRTDGIELLRWTRSAASLRARMSFLHKTLGAPWPAVDSAALLADDLLDRWLEPALSRARRKSDLAKIDVEAGLRAILPWPAAARLDELAPERITVPTGSRISVDYTADQPVLAVRVQEMFGLADTPRVADGRIAVLLHLLSPAQRPVAITADLSSFWRQGWPQVRAELRGRYPKHHWPDDPTVAVPTRRAKRRGE